MPVPEEAVPPRGNPPALSAWGMGENAPPRGGGQPRRVGFSVSHLDAALLVAALLIWTAFFVYFFAPR
ncbi:MAG: hypothetical protein ACLQGJ_06670 [Candidatus Dormibacteria bacterium]